MHCRLTLDVEGAHPSPAAVASASPRRGEAKLRGRSSGLRVAGGEGMAPLPGGAVSIGYAADGNTPVAKGLRLGSYCFVPEGRARLADVRN